MDDERLHELFSGVGPVSIRKMFGGKSIYRDGLIFAIDLGDELMLKADETSAPDFEAAGCRPWVYTHARTGRVTPMPYWSIPDEAMDDPDEMTRWARRAIDASVRIGAARAAPARKPKPKKRT